MTDIERKKALYLAIRRALLMIIGALDDYFGVKQGNNGGIKEPVAFVT